MTIACRIYAKLQVRARVFSLEVDWAPVLMYRMPLIAIFLTVVIFLPRLEGQMRPIQRPHVPARMSVGPSFRVVRPVPRLGGIGTRTLDRPPALFVRRPFPNRMHWHTFFGDSEFGEPITAEELPSEEVGESPFEERAEELNEQLIGGTAFLPYAVYIAPDYSEPYYQVAEQSSASVEDRAIDLFTEIDRLRDEVERLREGRGSREQTRQAAPQPPAVEEKVPTTVLIFQDGRRSEVQNYAIVDQTLWVFAEQRAHKMRVADLDLEATKSLNEKRGVEFRLP